MDLLEELSLSNDQKLLVDDSSRRIAYEVARGRVDLAKAVCDELAAQLTAPITGRFLDTPLTETGADLLTLNTLEREYDVVTVGQLLQLQVDTMLTTPQLGTQRVFRLLAELLKWTIRRHLALEAQTQNGRWQPKVT